MKEKETEKPDFSALEPYVTSTTSNVYAIRGLDGLKGPAFARYSRAKGGVREVMAKEFITTDGALDVLHANELIALILIQYGDDSVGELEGSHLCLELVSVLFTKDVEDRRIGGSPIEQSTRYVFYDQKGDDGNYRYYRGDEVLQSSYGPLYEETMNFIFETYVSLIEPLKTSFQNLKPLEEAEYDINNDGVKEKWADLTEEKDQKAFKQTYNMDIRTKACDVLRALLPLATLTNVGLFGNGRYFQEMLSFLRTTELPESHHNADLAREALDQVIPQFVRREARREYNASINAAMYQLVEELLENTLPVVPAELPQYNLMENQGGMIGSRCSMIAAMLYPYSKLSLHQLRTFVDGAGHDVRKRIWDTYIGNRENRRNRPGRALEDGYPYTFDLITNFGVYKDLERHRMCSQQRQLFTTKLGFVVPPEIEAIGAVEVWKECFSKADALFDLMAAENPTLAQYAVMHGHYVRWSLGINDRALMHMLELRSTPQGHPHYRIAAQAMHKLVMERDPWRGEAMSHVDHNHYDSNRGDSEARQRAKEAALDRKLGKN